MPKKVSRKKPTSAPQHGRFVVLDGPDGAGKSTQIKLLAQTLKDRGIECISLREPGGTELGEAVRAMLLNKSDLKIAPVAEAFLFQAARAQLLTEVVRPALERGAWVLCDRFILSTIVYQGYAGSMGRKAVKTLETVALQDRPSGAPLYPHLHLVLSVPFQESIQRRANREADRMESKGQEFLLKVARAYRTEARLHPEMYTVVNGQGTIEKVRERIWKNVEPLLTK